MTHALFLAVLLAQATPSPADKAKAQSLLIEGSDLYEAGKIEDALAKFNDAFATYPSPKILFNIGQANRDLGRVVAAIAAFDGFVSGAPDADVSLRNEAKRYIAELHTHVAWIEVEDTPDEADVFVDEVLRGRTPIYKPMPIEPGRRTITIRVSGKDIDSTVVLRAGQTMRVTGGVVAEESKHAPMANPAMIEANAATSDDPYYKEKWFIAGAAATAVSAVVAIVAGLSAGSKFDELGGTCGKNPGGCRNSEIESVESRARTANVFWALAAVGAAATGVGVYLHTQRDQSGVSVAWRF